MSDDNKETIELSQKHNVAFTITEPSESEFRKLITEVGDELYTLNKKKDYGIYIKPDELLQLNQIISKKNDGGIDKESAKIAPGAKHLYWAMAYCTKIIESLETLTGAHMGSQADAIAKATESFKNKRRALYKILCEDGNVVNVNNKAKLKEVDKKISDTFGVSSPKLKKYGAFKSAMLSIATFFCKIWPWAKTKIVAATSGNDAIDLVNDLTSSNSSKKLGKLFGSGEEDAFFKSGVENSKDECQHVMENHGKRVDQAATNVEDFENKVQIIYKEVEGYHHEKERNKEVNKKLEKLMSNDTEIEKNVQNTENITEKTDHLNNKSKIESIDPETNSGNPLNKREEASNKLRESHVSNATEGLLEKVKNDNANTSELCGEFDDLSFLNKSIEVDSNKVSIDSKF